MENSTKFFLKSHVLGLSLEGGFLSLSYFIQKLTVKNMFFCMEQSNITALDWVEIWNIYAKMDIKMVLRFMAIYRFCQKIYSPTYFKDELSVKIKDTLTVCIFVFVCLFCLFILLNRTDLYEWCTGIWDARTTVLINITVFNNKKKNIF